MTKRRTCTAFFERLIMEGGITPVGHPIGRIPGKTLKGFCRDDYETFMLDYLMKNGHPVAPSIQLSAQ